MGRVLIYLAKLIQGQGKGFKDGLFNDMYHEMVIFYEKLDMHIKYSIKNILDKNIFRFRIPPFGTRFAPCDPNSPDYGANVFHERPVNSKLLSFQASRQSNIIIDYEQSNLLELVLQNIADIGAISNVSISSADELSICPNCISLPYFPFQAKLWVFRSREDVAAFNEVEANPTLQNIGSAIRMPKVGFGLDKVRTLQSQQTSTMLRFVV